MAEERDAHNSRLLFSDLDVSDKGRPAPDVSASVSAVSAPFSTPLTSIAELAATLELDFEDDDGDAEYFARRGARETPAEKGAPKGAAARRAGPDDDPELDLLADRLADRDVYEPAFPEITRDGASSSVPTWEEFTRAFRTPPEEEEEDEDAQFAAQRWREGRRTDARFDGEPDGDPEDPLLEEDVDILSEIEGDEWIRYDAETETDEDDDEDGERPGFGRPASATQVIHPRERIAATDLAIAEGKADAARGAAATPAPSDTIHDMFADLDIDSIWDERLEKKKRPGRNAGMPGKADSQVLDMFDDIDLDALWAEKKKRHSRLGPATFSDLAKDETLILDPSSLDPQDTVIMEPGAARFSDPFLGGASSRSKSSRSKSSGGKKERGAKKPGASAPGSDDADLLAGMDNLFEGEDAAPAPPPAGSAREDVSEEEAFNDLRSLLDSDADAGAPPAGAVREPDPETDTELITGVIDAPIVVDDDGAFDAAEYVAERQEGDFVPDAEPPVLTADDLINDMDFADEGAANSDVSAPVIDNSAITRVRGPRPGTEEMQAIMGTYTPGEDDDEPDSAETEGAEEGAAEAGGGSEGGGEEAVAVNPMDVFANMDDMDFDFSDDMDEEMRAMLDEDGEEAPLEETAEDGAEADGGAAAEDAPPSGRVRLLLWRVKKFARRRAPPRLLTLFDRVQAMIAWKENWWFYCDLLAAIIASASLAVIISYYVWYKK